MPLKTISYLSFEYELFSKAASIDHLANYILIFFPPIDYFEEDAGRHELSHYQSEVRSLASEALSKSKRSIKWRTTINLIDASGPKKSPTATPVFHARIARMINAKPSMVISFPHVHRMTPN